MSLPSKIRNTPSTARNSMTGSERPSPEPILKKEASPAVLGGREFWKRSGSLKCLELEGLGHPSRTLQGNSRKRSESVSGVFPEFFRNFFRKVPAVLGVWPIKQGFCGKLHQKAHPNVRKNLCHCFFLSEKN